MIKATLGITKEPFCAQHPVLLEQQQGIVNMLTIHANAGGGLSVIIGQPGVGKSVIREHIEQLDQQRDISVVSCSRTLHTYLNLLKQLAESFKLDVSSTVLEKALIEAAFRQAGERKTRYIIIDEAHLLDTQTLRKLRLLFDRFPRRHNLILLGQPGLLHSLSLQVNQDIKSRVTYSATLLPLNDEALTAYIYRELNSVNLGQNTYNEAAIELILRSAEGNLRLCSNLCRGSLIDACSHSQKHWRSHDQLINNQVA